MTAEPPVLQLHGISKSFGALLANDGISLSLARGEVLALLGENGAGKSTLVSILFGHYLADAGHIEVQGRALPPGQPKAALAAGIGMVHQHFTLADALSVLDNVMLGTESLWHPFSRRSAARAKLLALGQRFGLVVDPQARVADLSVGERQRVEILKALYRGASILILDEPTAVLTPQESEQLFATLTQMVAQGLSIVFISHKLGEVLRVSHRIAVLRGGRLVALLPAAGASQAQLAQAMVGRSVAPARRPAAQSGKATAAAPQPLACALRGAGVRHSHSQRHSHKRQVTTPSARPLLQDINLAVQAGEIVAIAGVSGNGQAALAEVLCGLLPLDSGSLQVAGQALPSQPRAFINAGVARIPEDRHAVGTVGDLPLWENAILEHHHRPAFQRRGWLRHQAAVAHAQDLVQRFDVRGAEAAGVTTLTRQLSGGNMQKLILGRALSGEPGLGLARSRPVLIVAQQPTWGLDIGAVAYVHQQLLDAAAAGSGVLLISEDLDEVFALADQITVMHQGRLGKPRPVAAWTLGEIGLAMAGVADATGLTPGPDTTAPSAPHLPSQGPA